MDAAWPVPILLRRSLLTSILLSDSDLAAFSGEGMTDNSVRILPLPSRATIREASSDPTCPLGCRLII